MHELSIADAVLRLALAHARGRRITRVGVCVGHMRQVVPSALRFSFELVALGTEAEGAALEIEDVPAVGRCAACDTECRLTSFPLRCAACGGLNVEVVRGEELFVDWLDLEAGEPQVEMAGRG